MDAPPLADASAEQTINDLVAENRRLQRCLQTAALGRLTGRSAPIQRLRHEIRLAADCDKTVHLSGPLGGLQAQAARALHLAGRHADAPFISVNCGVLSAELLNLELFGNVSGESGRGIAVGSRLREADGGTLFLDEIDAVALPFQRKLLRILQQESWHLEDTNQLRPLDLRIIAATHVNLAELVERGLFRSDLYAHLSELRIQVPPLRDRRDDILPLVEATLQRMAVEEGRPQRSITWEAVELLRNHHWPGDVQEFENVIGRACCLDAGAELTADAIHPWLTVERTDGAATTGLTIREMERKLIEAAFTRFAGNRERTAQALQIGLRTLSGKLREYGYPPRGGPGSNALPRHAKAA